MGATQSTTRPYVLKTPKGALKGVEFADKAGKPICQRYTRVPYAQPPVGPLRWRRPQPLPTDFSFDVDADTPGDYTSFGPICPQMIYGHIEAELDNPEAAEGYDNTQDEDCLFLNIWVPSGAPPPSGWPVQIFLHGGWLQVGDAMQDAVHDPFDLLASTNHPRIIISPTYRLNVFGFLTGPALAETKEDPAPGNYGFWDQRAALEWTASNIQFFGGNADNISLGGLSAGANSTVFQLYYDSYLPASERLIKRVYLWSNGVGIQPNSATSAAASSQFDELCTALSVPLDLSPSEKLACLRAVPAQTLVSTVPKLDIHTFRGSTDDSFIPATFLSSLHSGSFTTRLAQHDVSVLLGEVAHESRLYRLVNPPSSYATLSLQLRNYYPPHVVDALLAHYALPDPSTGSTPDDWADIYATIVADCQVHAVIRGFTHCLLSPPPLSSSSSNKNILPLPPTNLHRYRICFRAQALDAWLDPAVGVCHGADMPIWWASGWRAGFTDADKKKVLDFLEPFGRFLYAAGQDGSRDEKGGWGGDSEVVDRGGGVDSLGGGGEEDEGKRSSSERIIRVLDEDGNVRMEEDEQERWEGRMAVWNCMWEAQRAVVQMEEES